jgi:hypothetical protein
MSIFTSRELEFLARLETGWRELYLIEVARLLKEDRNPSEQQREVPWMGPRLIAWNGLSCFPS